MKLTQHGSFKNFYLPAVNKFFFIFSTNTTDTEFDFTKAFTTYTFPFILVFYKDASLVIDEALRQKLQSAAGSRAIVWIDKLGTSILNRCPTISFTSPNQTLNFSNMVFGKDSSGSRIGVVNDGASTVTFNPADGTLAFKVNGTKKYKVATGAGQENEFVNYVIPLRHQQQLLGFDSKAADNNTGYLCFQMIQKAANSIQPKTALVSSGLQPDNTLHSYHYFEDESYGRDVKILVLIIPCQQENFDNAASWKFGSYMELFMNKGTTTNFVNELGSNFKVATKSSLVSRIAFVSPNEADNAAPNFFFTPKNDESLELESDGQYMLLGSSGTERQDKTTLVFKELENVLFKEEADGSVSNSKYARSVTSIATAPQSDAAPLKYYIDSEKKSLFDNKVQGPPDTDKFEVPYKAIEIGTISNELVPFIPTLSFKPGSNLPELEKLLVRNRLKHHVANNGVPSLLGNETFVTPQGFIRNGQKLSFIKPDEMTDKDGIRSLQFDVENVTMTSDFNLSIAKEDVFLVLRPSMMQALEKFNVTFSVRGFVLDLVEFNKPSLTIQDDTYIIFKFSQRTFKSLLNDPAKWSNYGAYKPSAVNAAELIKGIKEKTAFPKNEDYKYFNETILTDPNWNGVLVLNIPISSGENLPSVFDGLAGSQNLRENTNPAIAGEKLKFKTGMKFQYMAFTLNKTQIKGGAIEIGATSFYGIMDYDLLNKPDGSPSDDYPMVSQHFPKKKDDVKDYKFLLTKLLVRFENSAIKNFLSFVFLQLPDIFENRVEFGSLQLSHPYMQGADEKNNLLRLEGQYQKNSAGNDEFNFFAQSRVNINFEESSILKQISVSRLGFSYSPGTDEFRFDINAGAELGSWSKVDFLSIEKLDFENIGFKFKLNDISLPKLNFDLSKLLVFPKINFDGNGFLSSFPIKFSHFQTFRFRIEDFGEKNGFDFINGDFDFFKLPNFEFGDLKIGDLGSLFSFVFDFDLGTLGNLEALKALKGKLLIGWSFRGGFMVGFKLDGPSSDGLHLNLFGALKIDIAEVGFGKFKPPGSPNCSAFFLRLNDARLTIFGKELPGKENVFNGIIISDFSQAKKNIAWLINYDNQQTGRLVLGVGQHMGPAIDASVTSTSAAIQATKDTFKVKLKGIDGCSDPGFLNKINFRPERNWLIASEAILREEWPLELKFIFNDPVLYGIYLGLKGDFLKGFSVDILYKKLADNLGVYSTEIQLPDSIRSMELGGAFIRLPNIGVEIFTNGDWKVDVGFPANSNDWSRAGFIQLRTAPPFVGFFGLYMMMSKIASLTLFNGYVTDAHSKDKLQIVQAGFALRVGLGFYLDKGILYVGASITVYGVLEGAFAFEKQRGLSKLFPDHFALLGRFGALAELVGYVDFAIIKASVYISLRAEFGLLLVYIGVDGTPGNNTGKGIQPAKMYVEGEVRVEVSIKIGCVKIKLRFRMFLRFEYTIGGGGSQSSLTGLTKAELPSSFAELAAPVVPVSIKGIKNIPMVYLPAFSKIKDGDTEELVMLQSFMIPFFGKNVEDGKIILTETNLFKDKIIKPFFEELIKQLQSNGIEDHNTYDTLRSVLLNGHCSKVNGAVTERVKIDISIDGYVPTFINGINSGDKAVVDKVLKNYFDFTDADLKPADADNSVNSAYKEELLVVPAPISKRIQILDADKAVVHDAPNGFTLKVDGLVNDAAGIPSIVTKIDAVTDFDDDTLKWIEQFYDDYKTQFINRKKLATVLSLTNKDLREEVMIPEFFKLIALLTLEASYAATNTSKKNDKQYNPTISIGNDGQFTLSGKVWNPNDAIEQVIGQLNYFYNSGLRLPFKDGEEDTKAIYEILKQRVPVTQKPDAMSHLSDIKVSIDGKDMTADMFINDDAKKDMLHFVDGFESNFSLDKLREEFPAVNPILFTRPFDLVPVTLAVQNNQIGVKDTFRFLDIPAKLAQQGRPGSSYAFELNCASYDKQVDGKDEVVMASNKPKTPPLDILKCLNLEIKVRKHTNKVLEITGAYTKDLNLANALFNDTYIISKIDLFYKQETDPSNAAATTDVDRVIDTFTTILKTNLSPRTSPPLFEQESIAIADASLLGDKEYWDDSNSPDKKNFIRLVWEALTTNNGGYYFILDKEVNFPNDPSGKEFTTGTVILSLSGDQALIPAYFNTIKLSGDQQLFSQLDDRSHYLYIDSLKLTADTIAGKEIVEYHPRMPAHTMGFEIERKRSTAIKRNYQNYIPLEFALLHTAGGTVLSANKVLPLMPLSNDEQELRYSHMTPLVIQDKAADPLAKNIDRYKAIGEKYSVNINVRDVFGARTSAPDTFIATTEYQHYYFDKLVPLDAWPLIKFSYWLKGFTAGKLSFDLSCNCDILEVLDMAGIVRKPNGDYIYALEAVIDGSNPGETQTHIGRLQDLIPGLLNNLYNIAAQLTDDKTDAVINGSAAPGQKEAWRLKVIDLVDKLTGIITPQADGKYRMPVASVIAINAFTVVVAPVGALKHELLIEAGLKRKSHFIHQANDGAFKKENGAPLLNELSEPYIWDYYSTQGIATHIKPLNLATPDKSKLKDLDAEVRAKTGKAFCLGISSELRQHADTGQQLNEKTIYLINQATLAAIKVQNVNAGKEISDKCYFGIAPISNKLWSGEYKPSVAQPTESFTKIDLDKALRLVLEKIDQLLQAKKLSKEINDTRAGAATIKALFNKLVAAKKKLVETKLQEQIAWVMDNTGQPLPGNGLTKEFRSLLLGRLKDFYTYDGVIKTGLSGADALGDHRLTISLDTPKDTMQNAQYNLLGSKVNAADKEWYILFDQKENVVDRVNFDVQPAITHIEFDIKESDRSDIEQSTWIQLINPVPLNDHKYFVKNWPKITREFPERPVITKHTSEQVIPDDPQKVEFWDSAKMGLWNYQLSVKDAYVLDDIIRAELVVERTDNTAAFAEGSSFEGFIAYWASKMLSTQELPDGFDSLWTFFVNDLSALFDGAAFADNRALNSTKSYSFDLRKKVNEWSIENISDPMLKVSFPKDAMGNAIKTAPSVEVGPFNIFDKQDRVIMILPKLKVFRNSNVKNDVFQYETETIAATFPAMPHIRFFTPLSIKATETFEGKVFGSVAQPIIPADMSFKATATYLIDISGKNPSGANRFPKEIRTLPVIPMQQIECRNGTRPVATDDLFAGYHKTNGFPAFSLMIYGELNQADDLPVFYAENIFKVK